MRDSVSKWWQFPRSWNRLKLANRYSEAGSLVYPVLDNGRPFFIYRFDLENLPKDDQKFAQLHKLERKAARGFIKEYGVEPPFQGGRFVVYDDVDNIRADILRGLEGENSEFLGIDLLGVSFKLTKEQGSYLEQVLSQYKYPGEINVPLSRIPKDEFNDEKFPFLKTNSVGEALQIAKDMDDGARNSAKREGVWINAYRSEPFMYASPLVPKGYSLLGGKRFVPLLRVGNSLLSGDTDISSGLQTQWSMITGFQCRLLNTCSRPIKLFKLPNSVGMGPVS